MDTTLLKNLLKNNWKTLFVGIIALLVVIYGVIQFSIKYEEKELAKEKKTLTEKQIEDKIKSRLEKEHNAEIDSLKIKNFRQFQKMQVKVDDLSKSKTYYYNKYISSEKHAKQLANTKPECTDIAKAYQFTIDTLKLAYNQLDSINIALDNEAKTYAENWYLTEKQLKQSNIAILRKDSLLNQQSLVITKLEKNNTKYWKGFKDGFKWGFGTAIVIETSAIILLKK